MARQSGQSKSSKQKEKAAPQRRRSPEDKKPVETNSARILDDNTKRDIAGVIFIILAIVFMLIVALPPDNALVSDFASEWLHLGFGVGSYLLPFVLAAIGITFLYRTQQERVPTRAAIGLGVVFVALLGFIALFTPITTLGVDNTNLLFSENMLVNYGGYIGAGIAWAGITLFGHIVTGVVLVGAMLVGVLIIGFSISKLIDLLKKKKREHEERLTSGEIKTHQSRDRFTRKKRADEEPPAKLERGYSPHYDVNPSRLEAGSITRPLMGRGDAAQLYWEQENQPKKHKNIFRQQQERDLEGITRRLSHEGYGDMSAAPIPFVSPYDKQALGGTTNASPAASSNLTVPLRPLSNLQDGKGDVQEERFNDEDDARFEDGGFIRDAEDALLGNGHDAEDSFVDSERSEGFRLSILREGENGIYEEDPDDVQPTSASISIPDPMIDLNRISILHTKIDPADDEAVGLPLIDDIALSIPEVGIIDEDELRLEGRGASTSSARREVSFDDISSFNVVNATTRVVIDKDDEDIADETPSISDDRSDTLDDLGASIVNRYDTKKSELDSSARSEATIERAQAKREPQRSERRSSAAATNSTYSLPSMSLLKSSGRVAKRKDNDPELRRTAATLQTTLSDFGIDASVVGWIAGPTVTLFEVDLPAGVRVSRITALNDDIALSLAAPGVRIFAPIPGTNYVGIEVPNAERQTVFLADVIKDAPEGPLQIAIGKDVEGNAIVSDLAKMPHLLIGGTTGSGKSVSINAMIMSILMRVTPDEVRFIMIDPKRVEFTPYNGIPHLYVPVVTEAKEAASALSWGVAEMERRLKVFSKIGARNISQYNDKVEKGLLEEDDPGAEKLPYIVIIIDELADLMMNVGKEVEFSISRIAQLARAAGIHLIVATQRPSTNVVTGLIKANITNRIAFNVASGIDSRVILDTPGAENLIGLGDLLLSKPELAKPQRIQGCFVSEDEIFAVVEEAKRQCEPDYHSEILQTNVMSLGDTNPSGGSGGDDDPLLWDAADIVVSTKMGSTSNIQRRLKVGYARAGRIMDQLEEKGIVGPANGTKPREVLVDEMELATLQAFEMQDD